MFPDLEQIGSGDVMEPAVQNIDFVQCLPKDSNEKGLSIPKTSV
jgi:hypothetical protein